MLLHNTEAFIWIVALESALGRLSRAETRHERVSALEALEEARERLGELLDDVRDDALREELPQMLDVN